MKSSWPIPLSLLPMCTLRLPTITITRLKSTPKSGKPTSSTCSSRNKALPFSTRLPHGMPRTIRFHLDENCHHGVAEGLRRYGIDVTTTPEANLRGASDDEQLRFAVSQGRAFFTQDKDFLRLP